MNSAQMLKNFLAPLGVFRLESSLNGAELEAYGAGFDLCAQALEEAQRDLDPCTAQGDGLARWLSLLSFSPVTEEDAALRRGLAALFRVHAGIPTAAAVNDALIGCGVEAEVRETDTPNRVEILFPRGNISADRLERMTKIIEALLPCQLAPVYVHPTVCWADLATGTARWEDYSGHGYSWLYLMMP